MRSTRAASAIERLNARTGTNQYTMSRTSDGHFYLLLKVAGQPSQKISEALELDAFVSFVNAQGPQQVRRVSKLDVAFEKQLHKNTPPSDH
jgi:hypothetical protein